MTSANQYRPDIDGLRAVAVVSVVIFHLFENFLPAGYLGVDVFFVISGYLITRILWREMSEKAYSILSFYERRVRRLMPALFAVLTFSTLFAYLLLLPSDLVGYSKSLLATLAFVANIYFWRDTNYFSATADEKPLLHMWSLGIEEQFYIFFPFVLLFSIRLLRRNGTFTVVCVLTLASLALDFLVRAKGGATPAFYLLPTRAWELGAGAALALAPLRIERHRRLTELLAVAGLLFTVCSLAGWGPWGRSGLALAAVFGTSLLIAAKGSMVGTLLGAKGPRSIGLISYSMYLWHWPIIVFAEYYLVRDLAVAEKLAVFAITVVVGALSWRYVERPFRGRELELSKVLSAMLFVAVPLVALAIAAISHGGFDNRLEERVSRLNKAVGTHYRCAVSDYVVVEGERGCELNLPTRNPNDAQIVVLGNSHALMYAPAIESELRRVDKYGLMLTVNGCLPTLNLNRSERCRRASMRQIEVISKLAAVELVIIGMTWHHDELYSAGGGRAINNEDGLPLANAVLQLITRLEELGIQVAVIGPIARPEYNIASYSSRQLAFGRSIERPVNVSRTTFDARYAATILTLSENVRVLLPHERQCDDLVCDFLRGGESLFSDSNHLTPSAAEALLGDSIEGALTTEGVSH